jgi:monoterpene epsilon-lactone hydrolase
MRTILPRELIRHVVVRGMVRRIFDADRPATRQRSMIEALGVVHRLPRGIRREDTTLGGRRAEKSTPRRPSTVRVLLYLHGGGYIVGSPRTHRALAAHLAEAAGCAVFALDYRLAPEHPYPAALDDAEAAFHALAAEFDEVAVGGDSAGGGLAVALAIRLHAAGGRTPTALGLISPWIDLTGEHGIVDHDDMLKRTWSDACAAAYAGGRPVAGLVPAVDDLSGLPPTIIHVGDTEMLRPDSEWLAAGLRSAGVPVELEIIPRMWHEWHLHAGLFAEATDGARTLGRALSGTKGSLT